MTETRFEELKRYVRFGPAEAAALASLRPLAVPHFPRIAEAFYDRIREHEEAHAVLKDEPQVTRLRESLVGWLDRLLGGVYDEDYHERSSRVGRIHVQVGLPERYVFPAMGLLRAELSKIAEEALGPGSRPVREALHKLLDIDLAIMTEAYRDQLLFRIEQRDRDARATLEKSKLLYVDAVENARVMMVGLDADARVVLFNAQAERATGISREESIGRPFAELFMPPDHLDSDGAQIARGARARDAALAPPATCLLTRSGRTRDIRWSWYQGTPSGEVALFAVGQDVTDEVIARGHARMRDRLTATGTLAAGLAHEIRNPLHGAQLHVEVLDRALSSGAAGVETTETLDVIRDEIKRVSELVSEFLDFARPGPLSLEPVSVRALCQQTKERLASRAVEARVDLTCDLPSSDVQFPGDRKRLEQVMMSLASNAIDALASAGEGGALTLRARREPRHVRIEVEDTGPGIDPPDAPIFDAFYTSKPQGTGLGLAIAHRTVTDHDGTIDVNREAGKTTFRVMLPLGSGRTIDGGASPFAQGES